MFTHNIVHLTSYNYKIIFTISKIVARTAVSQYKSLIMENNAENSSAPFTFKDILYLLGFIFTILVLCGAAIGLSMAGVNYIKNAFNSSNWTTTTGEITASYVDKTGSDNTGVSFTAKVKYSYVVDDRRYESDRIGFDEPVKEHPDDAFEMIAPYEVGQPVTVYYNPEEVGYAVIEPGPTFNIIWLCAAGLFFFLFALAVIISFSRGG